MSGASPLRAAGFRARLVLYPAFWAAWLYIITWVLPWRQTNAGRDLMDLSTLGAAVVWPVLLYLWRPPQRGAVYLLEFLILHALLFPMLRLLPYAGMERLEGLFLVLLSIPPAAVGFALAYLVGRRRHRTGWGKQP